MPQTRVAPVAVHERLAALTQLAVNWDSYGGRPPTGVAIDVASRILDAVADQSADTREFIEPVEIAPVANGGVLLGWTGQHDEVELRIGPDGKLDVLYVDNRTVEPRYEEHHGVTRRRVVSLVLRVFGDGQPD